MNILSTDDLLAVFRCLPPRDRHRFAFLSKRTRCLKASNPKDFLKPTIEIVINPMTPTIEKRKLKILTPKRSMTIEVSSSGKIIISSDDNSRILMESFFHCADPEISCWRDWKDREKTVHFNVFARWLFSKFDVSVLRFVKKSEFTKMVVTALKDTECRCFEISVMRSLRDAIPNMMQFDVFTLLHASQQPLGVTPKFRLEHPDAMKMYPREALPSSVLSNMFGDVWIEFSPENMINFVIGICFGWRRGTYFHGQIRAHFERSTATTNEVLWPFIDHIQSLSNGNVMFCNTSWKELEDFINSPLPEKLEQYWDIRASRFPGKMRFSFSIDGPDIYLTAQMTP